MLPVGRENRLGSYNQLFSKLALVNHNLLVVQCVKLVCRNCIQSDARLS
jgi:hypothetical protein